MKHELDNLLIIHDCKLNAVSFAFENQHSRSLLVAFTCSRNFEVEQWAGKTIHLKADEIVLSNYYNFGYIDSTETINSINLHVSNDFINDLKRATNGKLSGTYHTFTISFSSGSILEVCCISLSLSVINS